MIDGAFRSSALWLCLRTTDSITMHVLFFSWEWEKQLMFSIEQGRPRFNQEGAHTIAGGSNRSRGLSSLTLTTAQRVFHQTVYRYVELCRHWCTREYTSCYLCLLNLLVRRALSAIIIINLPIRSNRYYDHYWLQLILLAVLVFHLPTCKKVKKDLYSAFIEVPYTQGAQVRITQCYLQITPYLPLPRKDSPDGASQTEVADI